MGAADPVKGSCVPGREATVMGGMTKSSVDSGAEATNTSDAMGPFETRDGCAKISYFNAYGGSSVCCDDFEYSKVSKENKTEPTDTARANSHLPWEMTLKFDAKTEDVTENTDTGGFLTSCLVVKNRVDAMAARDFVDHV